jgi:putative (di)nucleoside polyphosphate hydrolase
VGLFLLNGRGEVFVGHRNDLAAEETPDSIIENPWQMPQGGIDPGETPQAAALRELHEETGCTHVTILRQSREWYLYELPPHVAKVKWNGKYRGQAQIWFALRLDGTDAGINIATKHPEFNAWKWVSVDEVCGLVADFKRDVYTRVVAEFRDLALQLTAQP